MELHRDYHDEPERWEALTAFQRDLFGLDLARWVALGYRTPAYVSFSLFDGAVVQANVSTHALDLDVNGNRARAGGVLTVASREAVRGTGTIRTLFEAALPWCDERYDVLLLFAGESSGGLYEKFGFRRLREHSFVGRCETGSRHDRARALDLGRDGDRSLLESLARHRAPVSGAVGFGANLPVFMYNALHFYADRFFLVEDLGVAVATARPGDELKIIDVVGPVVPPFAELAPYLPEAGGTVEFLFPPDSMGLETAPRPLPAEEFPMVRGPFPPEEEPFMFPYTAHF